MIDEAVATGARRERASDALGVSVCTLQRWDHRAEDGRAGAVRSASSNKLGEAERAQVLAIANEPAHESLAPHQEVHASESQAPAASLLVNGWLREGLAGRPLVLHLDNGAAMKGSTMLATMQNLDVMPSFSRPHINNENAYAYAESLFRTAK